jgi:hypothetical protein
MYNSSIKVTKLLLLAISIVTTLTIILPANIIGQVWADNFGGTDGDDFSKKKDE